MTALSLRLSSMISRASGSACSRGMGRRSWRRSRPGMETAAVMEKTYRDEAGSSIRRFGLLPMPCQKAGFAAGEIGDALFRQQLSVDAHVADQHVQPLLKRF